MLCIFPSIWENFPTVCLEAMSAGRVVIGSKNGGMNEMLTNPISGILVNPKSVSQISKAIAFLIENPQIRIKFGENGRNKILSEYNSDTIFDTFSSIISQEK
ncbi:hypothetical protein C6366_18930 [Desulfonatronum sp. SC1]|nr:hypothetical protein C6366_18930 [Desulfonatronum sp. SC1]